MSNSFSPAWLSLRERYDLIARNQDIVQTVQRWQGRTSPLRVLDLGAGTGSNFRILSPRLDGAQQWLLVDHDAQLLQQITPNIEDWANRRGVSCELATDLIRVGRAEVQTLQADLNTELERLPQAGIHLLTASALMDLVSADWFEALIALRWPAIYLALNYNGQIDWHPSAPFDEITRQLLNRHQQRDKGFGPALGPNACEYIVESLKQQGYEVISQAADWRMQTQDITMQQTLLDGWREAVAELEPSAELDEWSAHRLSLIQQQQSRLRVGHSDIFAWLAN